MEYTVLSRHAQDNMNICLRQQETSLNEKNHKVV
jgi:hypothetical protein